MLFLVLFVAAVVTVSMVTVWSRPVHVGDAKPVEAVAVASGEPESLEGVLVVELLSGDISTVQYRHAVEGLAARDEDRHPLSVPPDLGPAQA